MGQTLARIKKAGKHFEIMVDLDKALAFKKDEGGEDFLEIDKIFADSKKGEVASSSDLQEAFKTEGINEIAQMIVKGGEILVGQEHRDAEQEKRFKQAVDFLAKNSIDPKTGNPHSPERVKNALEQSKVNIKNTPIESQINDILAEVSKIIPIKLETKRVKVIVPAVHTGQVYGLINQYKESEKWVDDGSLEVVLSVPSGIIMDFYDKLNSVTHGSAVTEEVKEE
jgi:ribosome maturation protein SDO1